MLQKRNDLSGNYEIQGKSKRQWMTSNLFFLITEHTVSKIYGTLGSYYRVYPRSLTNYITPTLSISPEKKRKTETPALSLLPPSVSQNLNGTDTPSPRLRPTRWHDKDRLSLRKLGIRIQLMSTCRSWTRRITHSNHRVQEIWTSSPVQSSQVQSSPCLLLFLGWDLRTPFGTSS